MITRSAFLLLLPALLVCSFTLQAQDINAFAGNGFGASTGTGGYTGDGNVARLAELNSCTGVTFDGAGNIYIADMGNNVIRKVNVSGIISTFAGNGTAGFTGDNGPADHAQLNNPNSVATDVWGNVYISDFSNNVVRVVNPAGTISTFAGNGTAEYSGDGGPATNANLSGPEGLAVDNTGNLYIADANNNVVRVVYTDGTIGTAAGNGFAGYSGNGGPAVDAQLFTPVSVAVDIYGNLYIADYFNNVVRIVDTSGKINNFAGNGFAGYSGNGGSAKAAQLRFPSGVSIYGFGDVYIADQGNNVIRKVNTSGIISTYAGTTTNGYLGDGGPAVNAELSAPKAVSVDGLGRLFIADYDNNAVRIIATTSAVSSLPTTQNGFKVYPNPSNGVLNIEVPETVNAGTVSIMDMTGRIVSTKAIAASQLQMQTVDFSGVPAGNYFVIINAGNDLYRSHIVVTR